MDSISRSNAMCVRFLRGRSSNIGSAPSLGCTIGAGGRWWRMWLFIVSVAIVLSIVADGGSSRDRSAWVLLRGVQLGNVQLKIPAFMPEVEERNPGKLGSVIFGLKDDCSGYFLRFLGVSWAAGEIGVEQTLPSTNYRIVSASSARAIELGSDRHGTMLSLTLSVRKPCGLIEQHDFAVIRFELQPSGTSFAVAGFIEPFLSRDALVAVARSIVTGAPHESRVAVNPNRRGVRHGTF